MSLIIGYRDQNKVYMACDTQRAFGKFSYSDATETGLGVFALPHGVLCGATNYMIKQALRSHPDWLAPLSDEPLSKRFLLAYFVPRLGQYLDDAHMTLKNNRYDGMILLAQEDRLYCIDNDFSVINIPKYCIIGDGVDYAHPRVHRYQNEVSLPELTYAALSDAKRFCKEIVSPFYLFTSDGTEKILLGGNTK